MKQAEISDDTMTDESGRRISVGQELRRAREVRRVTLAQLSAETRIALRHLEALEADRFDELPGRLYARNFVRTLARTLGADEQELLDYFDYQSRPPETEGDRRVAAGRESSRRRLAWSALAAAAGLIVTVLAFSLTRGASSPRSEDAAAGGLAGSAPSQSQQAIADRAPARDLEPSGGAAVPEPTVASPGPGASKPEPSSATAAQPSSATAGQPSLATAGQPSPATAGQPSPATAGQSSPATAGQSSPATTARPVPSPPTAAGASPRPAAAEGSPQPAATEPSPAPPARSTPPVAVETTRPEVRLTFTGPSWIEIVPVDGKGEQVMGLKDSQHEVAFQLESTVDITVANAGNVELWLDGRAARALGAPGERRTLRLDARNWRSYVE